MILRAVAQHIEDNGIATIGTDLFLEELPFDKKDCLAIMYAPSPDSDHAIDLFEQNLDVWCRFTSSQDAEAKMLELFNLFHKGQNYSIDGFHVYFSNAVGSIHDNGRDAKRRKLMKMSFRFVFRELQEDEQS